jgi:hypothetical protein
MRIREVAASAIRWTLVKGKKKKKIQELLGTIISA